MTINVKDLKLPKFHPWFLPHDKTVNELINELIRATIQDDLKLKELDKSIDPASISIIDLSGDSARLRLLNNTDYLSELKFSGSGNRNLSLGGGSAASRE